MVTLSSDYLGGTITRIRLFASAPNTALAQALCDHLQQLGATRSSVVALDADGDGADLAICIAGEADDAVAALNRRLSRQALPCLFVHVDGGRAQLGPWTYYGHTPCWACYRTTLRFFRGQPQLADHGGSADPAVFVPFVTAQLLALLRGESALIGGAVLAVGGGEADAARALKDPLCEVCSIWSRQPTEAFYVQQD
ncbi:hypothetical protein ACFJIW_19390 [Tahibacter sp. UC22_41]|uniref:hypothetical protein n=1 Tax=Tahibacter sp. UC22_41 TaxID=3350178 RepID=UPI0036DA4B21